MVEIRTRRELIHEVAAGVELPNRRGCTVVLEARIEMAVVIFDPLKILCVIRAINDKAAEIDTRTRTRSDSDLLTAVVEGSEILSEILVDMAVALYLVCT